MFKMYAFFLFILKTQENYLLEGDSKTPLMNKKIQKERELEDLLIDGISGGAVGGKLDQKSRVFEVILISFVEV